MKVPLQIEITDKKQCTINQSFLDELYNEKMWAWYKEWGLINHKPTEKILTFADGKAKFNGKLLENALNQGMLRRLRASMIFPFKAARAIKKYTPQKIDATYERETNANYSSKNKTVLLKKLHSFWELLFENMRYAFLAGLIEQYKLKIHIPADYQADVQAEKFRAMKLVVQKKLSKTRFDKQYGFLSTDDYDFSAPRYYELKKMPFIVKNDIPKKISTHNFREHIRFRSAKMVALIRKTVLALGNTDAFYESKAENPRAQVNTVTNGKKHQHRKNCVLSGVCMSEAETVDGVARILKSHKEYSLVKKNEIIIITDFSPNIVMLFSLVKGVVSEKGTRLAHLAVVARERNIPVLGQVANVTKTVKNGQRVVLDSKNGVIHILT